MSNSGTPSSIEDYALIGDCETAALVSRDGSIDWLCWPDFSSPACFARLLGSKENGHWRIAPANKVKKISRRYRAHTLILETTFETAGGSVMLVDFMPVRGANSDIVRIVRGIRGSVHMKMEMALRFDYGHTVPWVTHGEKVWTGVAGPNMVVLRTPVDLKGKDLTTISDFTVQAGKSIEFVMTYGPSQERPPRAIDHIDALEDAERFWEEWASRSLYSGPYRDIVERSLITLKALTYRPTGGIVAAPTTSLPEKIGGSRNWDYRYCWLRDATFTLLALINAGYYGEARDWQQWLVRAIAGSAAQTQIMYGIRGERHLLEWEVDWLAGYEASKPVRVGNAASSQLQLDIYGEVMDAFFHESPRLGRKRDIDFRMLSNLMGHLENIWQEPDEGIWETRGGRQCFTYSKVMAWVAFDRAIRAAARLKINAPVERWRRLRAQIHHEVCAKGYNRKLGYFTQAYGSDELDASVLLMPLVGFLPHRDARVKRTVNAIERRLMPNGLVLRYDTSSGGDGLPPGEGAFLACSFWMVSNLALMGRKKEAVALFEKLLSLSNDVGLLAEEYDTDSRRLVGNFPQAFSHIALVDAAFDLCNRQGASNQRQRREPLGQQRD